MHLVTSVFFLPSLMAYLKPESSVILLRSFFVTSLIVYLFRGTAALPIAEFYEKTTATPSPPGPQPTPTNKFAHGPGAPALTDKHADVWAEASKVLTPNPWYPILQTTIAHPNEHLCKLQRALAHFAIEFGETPAGTFSDLAGDLKGAEFLDGTVFIRAAGLTANKLGWIREGEDMGLWNFEGFFD